MSNNELFSEFPPVSKSDWLAQIAKDLKDTPLERFEWAIGNDVTASPFVHADDFTTTPSPLGSEAKGWDICEKIAVKDAAKANLQAMEALVGGAEALEFEFDTTPTWSDMEHLFAGIHADFIGLHFSGKGITENPSAVFSHLLRLAKAQQIAPASLRGSIAYDPAQLAGIVVDWRYLVDLLEFTRESFPLFRTISIAFSNHENAAEALAETLKTANEYFEKLSARGVLPEHILAAIQFSVPAGKSYFLEIAKIRAFKILWLNLLKGRGLSLSYPLIASDFRPEVYTDDLYTNMIRATSMAMSTVIGGADRLTVLPYDAGREDRASYPASFGRRIARNVQHLMKMESALDEVNDPAAGSYYIEKLSTSLAEKAWKIFAAEA